MTCSRKSLIPPPSQPHRRRGGGQDATLLHRRLRGALNEREADRLAIEEAGIPGLLLKTKHLLDHTPDPSRDDIDLTKRLVAAGEIMGIDVIDHVILADTRYFSFREAGKL